MFEFRWLLIIGPVEGGGIGGGDRGGDREGVTRGGGGQVILPYLAV